MSVKSKIPPRKSKSILPPNIRVESEFEVAARFYKQLFARKKSKKARCVPPLSSLEYRASIIEGNKTPQSCQKTSIEIPSCGPAGNALVVFKRFSNSLPSLLQRAV